MIRSRLKIVCFSGLWHLDATARRSTKTISNSTSFRPNGKLCRLDGHKIDRYLHLHSTACRGWNSSIQKARLPVEASWREAILFSVSSVVSSRATSGKSTNEFLG